MTTTDTHSRVHLRIAVTMKFWTRTWMYQRIVPHFSVANLLKSVNWKKNDRISIKFWKILMLAELMCFYFSYQMSSAIRSPKCLHWNTANNHRSSLHTHAHLVLSIQFSQFWSGICVNSYKILRKPDNATKTPEFNIIFFRFALPLTNFVSMTAVSVK